MISKTLEKQVGASFFVFHGIISPTAALCKCPGQLFTDGRDFFPEQASFNLPPTPLVLYICGAYQQNTRGSKETWAVSLNALIIVTPSGLTGG